LRTWSVGDELWSGSKSVSSWSVVMVRPFCRIGRGHRGLRGDHQTAGGTAQNPERSAGPQRQRRMAKPGYFASRCKGGFAAGGK
jgi:hypothetical protein